MLAALADVNPGTATVDADADADAERIAPRSLSVRGAGGSEFTLLNRRGP
jgi:hypothetical protein